MSYIPEYFQERLQREFDGRLRIRWSSQRRAYQIEAQCGRRNLDIPLFDPQDDDKVRARDGYARVMEIQPYPVVRCRERVSKEWNAQRCDVPLEIPPRMLVEVTCVNCQMHGRDGRTKCAYWPLDDQLLTHLRKLDPKRQWRDQALREIDLDNKRRQLGLHNDTMNEIDSMNYHYWNQIAGIPSVGWTGKVFLGN